MESTDVSRLADARSAELEVEFFVASARSRGITLVRIVHGEGRRATLVRKLCRRMKKERRLVSFLEGELLSSDTPTARYLCERFPVLADEAPSYGVTYLCLAEIA